jgi:hypothetical protein
MLSRFQEVLLTTLLVEFTLAVPVCWSARANAVMSSCLQAAITTVQFGTGIP